MSDDKPTEMDAARIDDAAFLDRFADALAEGTYCPDPSPYHAEVVRRGAAAITEATKYKVDLRALEAFLDRTNNDCAVVSTAALTVEQIAAARACDRMLVTSDGLGYVVLDRAEWAEAAKYKAALRRISNGRLGVAPDGTHIQARDVAIAALASPPAGTRYEAFAAHVGPSPTTALASGEPTPAILTVEECDALEAERAPIDTPESFRTRALATIAHLRLQHILNVHVIEKAEAEVAALRSDLAKREAMLKIAEVRADQAEKNRDFAYTCRDAARRGLDYFEKRADLLAKALRRIWYEADSGLRDIAREAIAPSPQSPSGPGSADGAMMSDRQGTCLPIIWWHHQDNDEKPLPEHEVCWWLVWDGGDAHMEVQLYRDGTVDWFACDRSKMSGSSPTGTEDAEPAAKVFADPAFSAGMVAVKDGYDAAVSAEVTALRADLAKRQEQDSLTRDLARALTVGVGTVTKERDAAIARSERLTGRVSGLVLAIENAPCLVARPGEHTYECRTDSICRVCEWRYSALAADKDEL